ncbi:hypothetical protein [Paenibacillus sp. HJGM_3]|uniref:hypothetical protein n=1 Tax=Paenibacillus sp. HJGM_3 TaxID=3379816 RepID=UPI00385BE234
MEVAAWSGMLTALLGMGVWLLPYVTRFLLEHGLTAINYEGIGIPTGSGLLLVLLHAIWLLLVWVLVWVLVGLSGIGATAGQEAADALRQAMQLRLDASSYVAAVLIVGGVGWLDDTVGDRKVKGWGGHWRRWRQDHVLTTGAIKAAGTGLAAVLAVLARAGLEPTPDAGTETAIHGMLGAGASLGVAALQVLLLLLMTNALNLLDLRPGRCLKAFLSIAAILFIAGVSAGAAGDRLGLASVPFMPLLALVPAAAGALVLLPGDLGARHMLGDAGAGVLGFAAGYAVIGCAPIWMQAGAVVLLLALHAYAETRSISAWIEKHRLTRLLDRWGRA